MSRMRRSSFALVKLVGSRLQAVIHNRACDVIAAPVCPCPRRYQTRPEADVESANDSSGACRSPHDDVAMPKVDPASIHRRLVLLEEKCASHSQYKCNDRGATFWPAHLLM